MLFLQALKKLCGGKTEIAPSRKETPKVDASAITPVVYFNYGLIAW